VCRRALQQAPATPAPKAATKTTPEVAPKAGPKPAAPAKPATPEAGPKPNTPAAKPAAAPAKGQEAAAGRTAAAGAKTTTTPQAGQGARPGIGKFAYEEPDRPSAGSGTPGAWVSGQGKRCVA
jgi:translation initiation factor IF-2